MSNKLTRKKGALSVHGMEWNAKNAYFQSTISRAKIHRRKLTLIFFLKKLRKFHLSTSYHAQISSFVFKPPTYFPKCKNFNCKGIDSGNGSWRLEIETLELT